MGALYALAVNTGGLDGPCGAFHTTFEFGNIKLFVPNFLSAVVNCRTVQNTIQLHR